MARQTVTVDEKRAALLLVDIQPDFMPGGALPVPRGHVIIEPTRALMASGPFRYLAATQDWHPPGHISFASTHAGKKPFDVIELYGHEQVLWPDHCVQGSGGAELHPAIDWGPVSVIVRKGMDKNSDSYSGIRNNWNPAGERPATGLAGYLRDRGIDTVFCCGLARDICVKWTAQDAAEAGFHTFFIWDLTRPVDATADGNVRADLTERGVRIVSSDDLVAG
jgi:nicotinamidase/pyrazinamidase